MFAILVTLNLLGTSGAKDLQEFFQSESDLVARSNEALPTEAVAKLVVHTAAGAVAKNTTGVTEESRVVVTLDEEADAPEAFHMKFETFSPPAAAHLSPAEKAEEAHRAAVVEAASSSTADWASPSWTEAATASVAAPQKPSPAPVQLRASSQPLPKFQVTYSVSNVTAGHLGDGAKVDDETTHLLASKGVPMGETDMCSCEFKGLCLCENAIEFMDCVSAKCGSGSCDCHDSQFMHACTSIAGVCLQDPANGVLGIDMQCTAERAACLVEENSQLANVERTKDTVYEELKDLKEKRCRLEMASDDGWLNAAKQLEYVNREIDSRKSELADMQAPLPEMHCEKHFEEWDNQHVPTEAPPPPAPAPKSGAAGLQALGASALVVVLTAMTA
jgi:hypothetical protein